MVNLNLGQDVVNKTKTASHIVAKLYPLQQVVRMRRYGSLINIYPSSTYVQSCRMRTDVIFTKSYQSLKWDFAAKVKKNFVFFQCCYTTNMYIMIHQVPADRWSLVSHVVSVRQSVLVSVQKTKYTVQHYMGPGGSLNLLDLLYMCVCACDKYEKSHNLQTNWKWEE